MKLMVWLTILMMLSPVHADYFLPEWTSECTYNEKYFELKFKSKSGDATNDDMEVSILTTNKVVTKLKIPEALYTKSGLTSAIKNTCHNNRMAAFAIESSKILFLFSKDMRPGSNVLVMALINVETGELLDFIDTDKMIKTDSDTQQITVKMKDGKLNVRLVTEVLSGTNHDGLANHIESWVEISVLFNKISIKQ